MICFYLVVLIIRRDVVAWYTHVVRYTSERRRWEVLLVIFFFSDFFLYDLLLWRYPRACLLDCLVGCLFGFDSLGGRRKRGDEISFV